MGPDFKGNKKKRSAVHCSFNKKGAQLFDDRRDKYHKGGQKKEDESVHGTFETQVAKGMYSNIPYAGDRLPNK